MRMPDLNIRQLRVLGLELVGDLYGPDPDCPVIGRTRNTRWRQLEQAAALIPFDVRIIPVIH